ncbi:hypothetical protein N9399_02520 [Porticoccaceae bacterium]|nr:hypothetical protein [Porticoccaceae bacterium]
MSSVKHRVSNVLAWTGFPFLPFLIVIPIGYLLTQNEDVFGFYLVAAIYGFLVWLPLGAINYIMVGSFRVFPWKKIGEGAE